MTRIIGGSAKGRPLKVPEQGTRPTSDRVREAVFSSLEHRLAGWAGTCVWDLYAGSGAFALEALSRGAARAVAVERERKAVDVIRSNAAACRLAPDVVQADVARFVQQPTAAAPDLVFVDPPYDLDADILRGQLEALCAHFPEREILLVIERSARDSGNPVPAGCEDVDVRRLGETSVTYAHWYGCRHD